MINLKPKSNLRSTRSISEIFNFRRISAVIAVAFVGATLAPVMLVGTAAAYGQVQSRNIELSDSNANDSGVTYLASFIPNTSANIGGIVIDFCSNDPIIGDSCTAPAGFSLGASPSVNVTSGIGTGGSWGATSNGAHNTLFETNATPQAITNTSTAVVLTITAVHNPTAVGTFYARFVTYDTQADANAYTSGSVPGAGVIDAGGVALSTVQTITITSKVQEVLTFCVYTTAFDNGTCSGTGSTVTLGNNNGVLSTSGPYVDNSTKYDIQSNALHGVTIRFTGTVPTTPQSNVIESSTLSGMGAAASTAYTSVNNTPQFGLCTWAAGGTTANLTPAAPYNSGLCSGTIQTAGLSGGPGGDNGASFAFNIAAASSTYGDTLANAVAGTYAEGEIAFIGNISNTTVAGIYQTTLTFIATGTY